MDSACAGSDVVLVRYYKGDLSTGLPRHRYVPNDDGGGELLVQGWTREGEVIYHGERMKGGNALQRAGLTPLCLQAKEGIALINGTHMMEAIATLAIADAQRLLRTAEVAWPAPAATSMSHLPSRPASVTCFA